MVVLCIVYCYILSLLGIVVRAIDRDAIFLFKVRYSKSKKKKLELGFRYKVNSLLSALTIKKELYPNN